MYSVKPHPFPHEFGSPSCSRCSSIPWIGHSQAFEGVVEKAVEGTEPQKETKESKEQEPTEPTEATEPTIEAKGGKAPVKEATGQDTEPVETPTKAIEAKDADLKDTAGDAMEDVSEKMLEEKQNEEKPQPHKGFLQ